MVNKSIHKSLVKLLLNELVPALGCTEPIAIALGAAKLRDVLGFFPERLSIECSGNIIKNVQSVTIPNSQGKRGIEYAAVLGALCGGAENGLSVLETVTPDMLELAEVYINDENVEVILVKNVENLFIKLNGFKGNESAVVTISGHHDNFTFVAKDGVTLEKNDQESALDFSACLIENLNIDDIISFVDQFDFSLEPRISNILEKQIDNNYLIAREGLAHPYGSQIGRLMQLNGCDDIWCKMISSAAAGSDARMGGSSLPVIIVSGSGNQGITASVPLIIFALETGIERIELKKALLLSNVLTLYQKQFIGRLSAFCGVVSAAGAVAGALAYLQGYSKEKIASVVSTTAATSGGMLCDGAKASCAGKIATALQSARLALSMVENNSAYQPGEGIVAASPEQTIRNIGKVAKDGMHDTDLKILEIMLDNES